MRSRPIGKGRSTDARLCRWRRVELGIGIYICILILRYLYAYYLLVLV